MLVDPNAYNDITGPTLAAAIEVQRVLGPGLLESTYMPCFQYELSVRNIRFVTQQPVPVV
jgi:GxxExxY protein